MPDGKKLQVGLTGPNKTGIMGYHTLEVTDAGSLAFVGNDVRVQMAVSINGLKFGFKVETDLPLDIFQQLMNGKHGATVQLVPFETEARNGHKVSQNKTGNEPKPQKRERPKDLCDPSYEPKRKSAYNSKLGTSGRKKYYKAVDVDIEVSWVDIVELAHKKCGSQTKLQELYKWAEENVYIIIDHQKYSVSHLSNWEASIRQNRRKTKNYAGPSNSPEKGKFIIDEQSAYDLNAELDGLPEDLMDGLNSPLSADENKIESVQFSNEKIESVQFSNRKSESVEDYINNLAGEVKMSAENFERTKIPMRNRQGTKQPMDLPCVIPNPYEESESELQYDFLN
jgi:hypothetical protein